jgi:hypothetical protein
MTTQHTITTDHGVSTHHFLVAIDEDLPIALAQAREFALTLPPHTAAVQVERVVKEEAVTHDH